MKQNGKIITAEENKVLRCRIDGVVYGNEVSMGKTFYRDGRYVPEGIETTAEDYEEIWGLEFEGYQFTSDAKTYDELVTALIRLKYSLDAELALLANLRKDAKAYENEEKDFQTWREVCKTKAKELLEI